MAKYPIESRWAMNLSAGFDLRLADRLKAAFGHRFDGRNPLCYVRSLMIHENLSKSIEDLSARMIAIRDSL